MDAAEGAEEDVAAEPSTPVEPISRTFLQPRRGCAKRRAKVETATPKAEVATLKSESCVEIPRVHCKRFSHLCR